MEKEVDIIVTSGGVGPTHDDVTMKSVSAALSSPLMLHTEMADLLKGKMGLQNEDGSDLSEAQIKMATLPACGKLRYLAGEDEWPTLECRNIYILPGVPQFFEKKVETLAAYLSNSDLVNSVTCKLVLSVDEVSVVPMLNEVVDAHPHVSFGSYPFVGHPEFHTVVTLEANECEGPNRIARRRSSTFRESSIVNVDGEHMTSRSSVMSRSSETTIEPFSKEQMELHVKLAVTDLVGALPENSVLRVDNDDAHLCE
mmetsp:Transcript_25730/g.38494  ORF Transcript_25730/g.38494 Transcript_25730/m.38494 type:complete len:255 (-) Transcript_25730:148-912(-)